MFFFIKIISSSGPDPIFDDPVIYTDTDREFEFSIWIYRYALANYGAMEKKQLRLLLEHMKEANYSTRKISSHRAV